MAFTPLLAFSHLCLSLLKSSIVLFVPLDFAEDYLMKMEGGDVFGGSHPPVLVPGIIFPGEI